MPPEITFVRLSAVAPREIIDHMSDPRVATHLPLLTGAFDQRACAAFLDAKDACWRRDGLGHWAILADGVYAGWGGFQKEGVEWDFGLVLKPDYFGLGVRVAKKALVFARNDPRIPYVTFMLAESRKHLRAFDRLGAGYVGETRYGDAVFVKYRLDTN